MHVVATAGHVDHGKSTLVRALTGVDPDRLEEERRRGLSIELGYCWTELEGVGEVAFVDVPGHQRFITTTLAGLGPVPVALLVVAADDPWMPQAAEHLAALDALGVRHGVLVVTRADLADPEPARARAAEEVARTSLAGIPQVTVSGRTGEGVAVLREALAGQLRSLPTPDPGADVRLWVDRSFHVRGAGTVVTGTLPAGTVRVGDELEVAGERVRVRGVESLGRAREAVRGVARVALDLGGRAPGAARRGAALVSPGRFRPTAVVDVRVRGGGGPPPRRPVLHLGSTHLGCRVRPLGGDVVRLALDADLPLRVGDRAILRDPGRSAIWGVEVLDPQPPPLERRGAAAARARELAGYDGSPAATLRLRGLVADTTWRELGLGAAPASAVRVGPWLLDHATAQLLRERLVALVGEQATALQPGLPVAAAAQALGLPDPEIVTALVTPPLVLDRGRVVDGTAGGLPPELAAPLERLREQLADQPFAAPAADVLREIGLGREQAGALHRGGHVLRLAEGVVLLPDAAGRAVERLAQLPQPFTASQARRALGTSRRVVLPLLAHLDSSGRTLRLPDDTRRVR